MIKTCIIVAGPTAIGKTAIALELARHFSTEIISADSRQCYRELGIGVAKPTALELSAVKHYFIDSHSIHDEVTAAGFEQYAMSAAAEIFSGNDVLVMVGGTGLYIRALMYGLDRIPSVDPSVRDNVIAQYDEKGIAWLEAELRSRDPLFSREGEMKNPQRMMRALEVILATGQSILHYQQRKSPERPFKTILVGLDMPRDLLYERINHRVDVMMDSGLLEEARALYPFRHLNALQTVGYRELFDFFDLEKTEGGSLAHAIDLIKRNTRHYAKRQLTWFRREDGIVWCPPDSEAVMEKVKQWIC